MSTLSSSTTPLKRKASGDLAPSTDSLTPKRIRPLDPTVVNKIAAGEIIVAPVNALKELIENAVDAGATSVDVVAKEGGMKLLQITDNGCGINKEDLPILCERHTTSKLKAFEDLQSIGTYGFRGEALASISHVAHLTVTTKTRDSDRAWRAVYADGKLVPPKPGLSADPKPVAGRNGTQLTVEDLFYNMPTRLKAFRSASEEYQKILDVVGRYAVHCAGVAFSCKKFGDSDLGVSVTAQSSTVDRIRNIYGSPIANELISIDIEDKKLGYSCKGFVTNANYSLKKTSLLLFINHRAVESLHLKKSLDQTYAAILPKGGKPFAYLSLEIEPQRVDVNVHPTKRFVNFLNEDEIIEMIMGAVGEKLASIDTSRTFLTQTLLPASGRPPLFTVKTGGNDNGPPPSSWRPPPTPQKPQTPRKVYENNLNRVDPTTQKITALFKPAQSSSSHPSNSNLEDSEDIVLTQVLATPESEWTPINYRSIRKLRQEVLDNMHNELYEIVHNCTFVGLVSGQRRMCAIQHGVKLYLINYAAAAQELFYQIGLADFANFGKLRFENPLDLRRLLEIGAEEEKSNMDPKMAMEFDWGRAIEVVLAALIDKREMLDEYFSIRISEEGLLETLPLLVPNYTPPLGKLPRFLLSFGPNVDWTREGECFKNVLSELALLYTPVRVGEGTVEEEKLAKVVEEVLIPACKKRLVPGKELLKEVMEVANLRGLYRVFERC